MKKELKAVTLLMVIALILAGYILAAGRTPAEAAEPEKVASAGPAAGAGRILEGPAKYDVPLEKDLLAYIIETAEASGVDPALVLAVIGQESNYDVHAIGDGGRSLGLMQVQPGQNAARMDRLGVTDPLDGYENVTVGIDLLADLLGRGNTAWALMAYNGGESYADALAGRGEISEYAESVLYLAGSLSA